MTTALPGGPDTVSGSIDRFRERFVRITEQVGRRIVGHEDIVNGTVTSLLAGGHVLLEGVPGVGKTSLVHTLADVLHLKFSRIQFTPDLMPADIVGTNIVQEHSHGGTFFEFQPGPIFANIVLADEINRATPKTQSALLEAMQDVSVSVGKTTYKLEAAVPRARDAEPAGDGGHISAAGSAARSLLLQAQGEVSERRVDARDPEPDHARFGAGGHPRRRRRRDPGDAARRTVGADCPSRAGLRDPPHSAALIPAREYATALVNRYVRYGASPRAAQALVLAGKIQALNSGQAFVSIDDIRSVALPALRHRILLNFEGEADEVDTDAIVTELLASVTTE